MSEKQKEFHRKMSLALRSFFIHKILGDDAGAKIQWEWIEKICITYKR